MNQSPINEVEYRRRLLQLMSFWGLSEVAILMHARRNHVDIALGEWDNTYKILTRRYVNTVGVQTRQVGRGFLGEEFAPGEVRDVPTDVMKVPVPAPLEPSAHQMLWWNRRIRFETYLSKSFGRDIKFPFPLW